MRNLFLLLLFAAVVRTVSAEEPADGFAELGGLPEPAAAGFEYKLSIRALNIQGYVMQGHWSGVSTNSTVLQLKGDSPKRVPGDANVRYLTMKSTAGKGLIDIVVTNESIESGMPDYPPDKPGASFRCELRSLILVNNEARVRIRFKDSTDYFRLRYEDGVGLHLETLSPEVQIVDGLVPDFRVIEQARGDTTYYSNALTTWAMDGDKLLWSIDLPMEGQPDTMKVINKVVFITTTAGHSFYILRDTGAFVFYEESIMPGNDPIAEVLKLGRENMKFTDRRRRLERFITACVVLDDRRAIPFLIDCIENGNSLQPIAMAIAALEKFNGNPNLWSPKNPKAGSSPLMIVGMDRAEKDRDSEIAKWREVFADELAKYSPGGQE